MANPQGKSRRKARRRKMARQVAGKVLGSDALQKGLSAAAGVLPVPGAGQVTEFAMERVSERLTSGAPSPRRGRKAAKKAAKRARRSPAQTRAPLTPTMGTPPARPSAPALELVAEDLAVNENGQLVPFPSAKPPIHKQPWFWPALLGGGFLAFRAMRKK